MKEPVIRRRKIGDQQYRIEVDGRPVGEAAKTGTHLDHYPWDWMFFDGIVAHGVRPRYTGVEETLRSAVDAIAHASGAYAQEGQQ